MVTVSPGLGSPVLQPARTVSGAELPLVALPQASLLSVSIEDSPVLRDALGQGVSLRVLRLDLERNEWVVEIHFAPGFEAAIHYHTGPAEAYTLKGRWFYKEYPDEAQCAGSYLYEPGGSVHTFTVPDDNTEETVLLVRVAGSNISFDESGVFRSVTDACWFHSFIGRLAGEGRADTTYIDGGASRSVMAGSP